MKRLAVIALALLASACSSTPQKGTFSTSPYVLPSPPPAGEPADLIGLTASQLTAKFGMPAFSRREYGSEMWRYDVPACKTFFFLYPAGREMAVRHVETVPHAANIASDPACLTALRAKPASPTS